MRRSIAILTSLACLLTLDPQWTSAGTPNPAELATHDWLEVRTPHFTVLSDARESLAIPAARRIEELAEMFRVLFPGLRPYPMLPVDVYVFRDEATLASFTPSNVENISGYSVEGPGRFMFVMHADIEGAERGQVVAHEYTHLFLRANFSEVPIWMNEGLAQYFQTFRVRGSRAEFGHKLEWAPYWLNEHEWSDLELLFAMKLGSAAYQRDNDLRTNTYAQGWALTHYLQSTKEKAARFDSILVALRRGLTPRMAFRTQYPPDQWPGIVDGARKYVRDGMFDYRTVSLPPSATEMDPRVRKLRSADALVRLGDLMLGGDPEERASSAALFTAALAEDSTLARAQAGLGYLADLAGDSAKAESWYQRAERRAPADPRVHLLVGLGQLNRCSDMEHETEAQQANLIGTASRARAHFEACLKAEADNPEALAGVAFSRLATGDLSDPALGALTKAADMLPSRKNLKSVLAEAQKAKSERDGRSPGAGP
jgi:tetratricopeptide (TPR) repeat protein